MILQDLSPYDKELENIDFSVQCNGACLNGVVSADVVGEYCQYICDLFEDEEFLKNKEKMLELEEHSFGFFSEMEAFERYKDKTSRPWKHLLNFSQLKAFDDCICQEHGFQMMDLSPERKIKQLFTGDGKIYGKRNDDLVEFVTLNLSWVPDSVFQWVFSQVVTEKN